MLCASLSAQHFEIKPFKSVNVVSLEAGNSVYVDVDSRYDRKLPDIIFAVDASGKPYKSGRLKAGQYVFEKLANNLTITVFYNDLSGTAKGIGEINTSYYEEEDIPVSREMHRELRALIHTQKMSFQSIYEHVSSAPLSWAEKASFLQRYFLDGEKVSDLMDVFYQTEKKISNPTNKMVTCRCKQLVVLPEFVLNPGDIMNAVDNGRIALGPVTHVIHHDPGSSTPNFPIMPELEYFVWGAGPSKLMFSYSDGYKRQNNVNFGGSVGQNLASNNPSITDTLNTTLSQNIAQTFTLLCGGGEQDIPDCDCEKDVTLGWFYESHIDTRASLLNSNGTRRAVALGEDAAIAYYIRDDPRDSVPIMNIVGSTVNRNQSMCNAETNNDWVGSGLATVASLAGLAYTFTDTSLNGTAANAVRVALINQAVTQLGNFIDDLNQPIAIVNDCIPNIQVEPGGLISPATSLRRVKILPNKTLIFGISSGARMVNTGVKSWQSEVVIRSDFYLAAHFPSGRNSGKGEPDCCSTANLGYYWGKVVPEIGPPSLIVPDYDPTFSLAPPSDQTELRSAIARFFRSQVGGNYPMNINRRGDYTVDYDYGTLVGSSRLDRDFCTLLIPDTIGGVIIGTLQEEDDENLSFSDSKQLSTGYISDTKLTGVVYNILGQRVGRFNFNYAMDADWENPKYSRSVSNRILSLAKDQLSEQTLLGVYTVVIIAEDEPRSILNAIKFVIK